MAGRVCRPAYLAAAAVPTGGCEGKGNPISMRADLAVQCNLSAERRSLEGDGLESAG